jgi:hypothetical protein
VSGRRELRDVPGQGAGVVCVFGCGRPVSAPGLACWPCQSYEEYLAGPRCPCDHERGADCVCDDDCGEYCPELDYLMGLAAFELQTDGLQAGQPRVAPERSDGEG